MIKKENIEKILSVIMVLVALVLGFFLFREYLQQNQAEQQVVSQMQEQSQQMNAEIRAVQQEITDKEKELEDIQKTPYIFLCFSGNDSQLMSTIYPLMNQYGYRGTLILKAGQLPGEGEQAVTAEEATTLLASGWDIALGGPAGEVLGAGTIGDAHAKVEGAGYGTSQAFFFDKGDYSDAKGQIYPQIEELGYRYTCPIATREGSFTTRYSPLQGDILECQNLSIRQGQEMVESILDQAVAKRMPLALSDYSTDGTWQMKAEDPQPDYGALFELLNQMQGQGSLVVGTFQDYTKHMAEYENQVAQKQAEIQQFTAEKQKEIDAIKEKYQ